MSGPTWARMTPEPAAHDPRNGQELILNVLLLFVSKRFWWERLKVLIM